MIEIDSGLKLLDIEKSLLNIYSKPNEEIKLPRDFLQKRIGALHDAARLQLIVTWARSSESKLINFDQQVKLENVIEDYSRSAVGIAALRIALGIQTVEQFYDRRTTLIPAAHWMELADAGRYRDIIKGRTIELISVSGAKLQFLRPLFSSRSASDVRTTEGMLDTLRSIFAEVARDKESGEISDKILEPLAIFTHQLFLNTQEHAIRDYLNKPLASHVEGMMVSWKMLEYDQVGEDFSGHPELIDFWNREVKVTGNTVLKETLKCIQVSFFDSGPGFVSRAKGVKVTDLPLATEREELINCLRKNVSSKKQTGSGVGLHSVLETLRLIGGLIRIRTGRMSIFNSFKQNESQKDIYEFQNWTEDELSPVEGAVVSILIPIRK